MELLLKHREIERGAGELNRESLEFDPDKLIESGAPEPESALSDPEYVAKEVEGLSLTNQEMRILDNGNTLYDSPNETGKLLNSEQGRAVPDIQGDCGLVSCENIARMAGKNVTEADVIKIAREGGLCLDGCRNPADNGGTTLSDICEVLKRLGIESSLLVDPNPKRLADAVASGRGVIVGVEVSEFWNDFPYEGGHAIVLTSVERNPFGKPIAFYVCDSGSGEGDSARRVDADTMERSLDGGPAIATARPIR